MPRARKHADDAARQAASRKRKSNAAAVAKDAAILQHVAELRNEITLRLGTLGCERKRRWFFLPDPSAVGYDSLLVNLIMLLKFIEEKLDETGVLANRGMGAGKAPRGPVVRRLESLRDEMTRRRAAAGLQREFRRRMLPGSDGTYYAELLEHLIDLMNAIQKELERAESWQIKA